MKLTKAMLVFGCVVCSSVQAQQALNWNDSPNNFQNSQNNWENSPNNFQNSPNNWQNSPNNYSANNGVYDNQGNRVGYEVRAPSGVTNVFDNNGNRVGYVPSQRNQGR